MTYIYNGLNRKNHKFVTNMLFEIYIFSFISTTIDKVSTAVDLWELIKVMREVAKVLRICVILI